MMATVPHVTSGLGLRKFQADGFLLTRAYLTYCVIRRPRLIGRASGSSALQKSKTKQKQKKKINMSLQYLTAH